MCQLDTFSFIPFIFRDYYWLLYRLNNSLHTEKILLRTINQMLLSGHVTKLSQHFILPAHHSAYLCLKTSYSPHRHLRSPLQIDQTTSSWGMISMQKVMARHRCWAAPSPPMYIHIFQLKRTFDVLTTKTDKAIGLKTLSTSGILGTCRNCSWWQLKQSCEKKR